MSTSLDIVRTNENLVFFKCQQGVEILGNLWWFQNPWVTLHIDELATFSDVLALAVTSVLYIRKDVLAEDKFSEARLGCRIYISVC